MVNKARFHLVSEAGAYSRTTVVSVKTIQLVGQPEIFVFPRDKRTNTQHVVLFNNDIVKRVVASSKTRNKFRNVVITLTDELSAAYLDEEGNFMFNNEYFEEVSHQAEQPSTQQILSAAAVTEKTTTSIAKDIVLEKFNGENAKASTWVQLFTQECDRVGLKKDKYVETLKLFLEGSALNWFAVIMKQCQLTNWEEWNNSFIDTFSSQSWVAVAYAFNFKYLNGSLLEFALKKMSLILEVDEDLTVSSQINLIVITLPKFIQDKLDNKNLPRIEDLMAKL